MRDTISRAYPIEVNRLNCQTLNVGEDIVCSLMKVRAGAFTYRVQVTTERDNKFDGDTASLNMVYSDEALAEVKKFLGSPAAYVNPNGGFLNSPITDTVERVIFNLTGDPK